MEVLPSANFQPDIIVNGLRLGEPMIALTSMLVSMVCFYAWFRIGNVGTQDDTQKLSRIFFFLMGVSTMVGAIVGHLFLYRLPFVFKAPGWIMGMIAVSALEQASIVRARPLLGPNWGKGLSWLNMVELTLAMWFVTATLWFPGVEIHSAFGFLCIIAPLEIILLLKTRNAGSRYILYGILFLLAAVLFHIFKISIGIWFSYYDIAHLMMCGAFWLFMLGAESTRLQGSET